MKIFIMILIYYLWNMNFECDFFMLLSLQKLHFPPSSSLKFSFMASWTTIAWGERDITTCVSFIFIFKEKREQSLSTKLMTCVNPKNKKSWWLVKDNCNSSFHYIKVKQNKNKKLYIVQYIWIPECCPLNLVKGEKKGFGHKYHSCLLATACWNQNYPQLSLILQLR